MILNDIKAALESVDPRVYYGAAGTLEDGDLFDYIVFFRNSMKTTGGNTGVVSTYQVAIIRESFIPEETVEAVIKAMKEIAGMRLAGNEFSYYYEKKPKTNTVLEVLVLDFMKPRKN